MKDLISESLTIFQSQRFKKKVAEAQIELALCYWRTGEYNHATDFLNLALARLPADSDLKAKAIIRTAIIDIDAAAFPKRYDLSPSMPPSFKGLTTLQRSA